MQAYSINNKAKDEKREKSPQVDTEMDLKNERWAQSPGIEGLKFYNDKSHNQTKKH